MEDATKQLLYKLVSKLYQKIEDDVTSSKRNNGVIHLQYDFVSNLLLNDSVYFKNANYNKVFDENDEKGCEEQLKNYEVEIEKLDGSLMETMDFIFKNIATTSNVLVTLRQ